MTNKIRHSLVIIILSSTLLFTGANQAGEAKTDTLKPLTVTKSVMSGVKFEIVKIPKVDIKPIEIEPVKVKPEIKTNKIITMNVSAYSNHEHSTGKTPSNKDYGVTASGSHTKEGRTIAADWRILPKGTKVYIEGLGERTVEDKGGAIKGNKIDVYFESEKEAIIFGRKQLKVTIID